MGAAEDRKALRRKALAQGWEIQAALLQAFDAQPHAPLPVPPPPLVRPGQAVAMAAPRIQRVQARQ